MWIARFAAISAWVIAVATQAAAADQVVVERDVEVTMRDGTILRADVFRPDQGGPYPVLVMRTPYGKQGKRFDRYVNAGYIVVCQDARGRFSSDGEWESFIRLDTHDAEDGYDTVQWAARLANANGKVGTFGASYNAFLQWRLAALNPSSLVAMSAHSIPARMTDLEGPGTIRPGRRLKWWLTSMTPDMRRRAGRPGIISKTEAVKLWDEGEDEKWLRFLPWSELPWQTFEDEYDHVMHWLKYPHLDPWKLDEAAQQVAVPNLDVVGWYDHCNGDMLLYRSLSTQGQTDAARKGSRLIVGPWSHSGRGKSGYGPIQFGPEAKFDIQELEIRWFDYWLKGKRTGIDEMAPVRIFVMGDNQWRDEPGWPLDRTVEQTFYLNSGGYANTPSGDGRLITDQSAAMGTDRYVYDPDDPVPSLHGKEMYSIPTDQRQLADRQDILSYQSEPLEERLEVTGNPSVELYAASTARDTDFFVRLIDVRPDGLARDVSLGLVRTRYRNGLDKPQLIEPGQIVKYTIRMNPTSNAFLPGHRIRLDVTSSDFPNYDRNHNTPADQNSDATLITAEQTIHHGLPHGSKINLPTVPNMAEQ